MEVSIIDFLFQLSVILFSTKFFGLIARRLGLPQVFGFILAGILIGPAIWGNFFDTELFPLKDNAYLEAFSKVGVIFVMFSAGLEAKIKELKNVGFVSFAVAMAGVLLPLGAGTLIGYLFLPNADIHTWLFVGVIMTATSVGITVEVLRELGKLQTKVGMVILSAALIDDILGILVLTVVLNLSGNGAVSPVLSFINPDGNIIVSVLWIFAFFALAIGGGIGLSKLFKFIESRSPHTRRIPIFSIATCLLYSFVAEKVFGVADITGAFIAGVMLSTNHESAQYVDRRVSISSYLMFAPIFFARIGIGTTFSGFSAEVILFSLSFVLVAIVTKIIGCGGMAKVFGFSFKDSLRVGVGMITRGEVALVVTQKGVENGLIDPKYIAITVFLVLTSSLFAPILLKLLYKGETGDKGLKPLIEENGGNNG